MLPNRGVRDNRIRTGGRLRIGAEGAKALAAALPQTHVTTLNLGYNSIGAEGREALKAAQVTPQALEAAITALRGGRTADSAVSAG